MYSWDQKSSGKHILKYKKCNYQELFFFSWEFWSQLYIVLNWILSHSPLLSSFSLCSPPVNSLLLWTPYFCYSSIMDTQDNDNCQCLISTVLITARWLLAYIKNKLNEKQCFYINWMKHQGKSEMSNLT